MGPAAGVNIVVGRNTFSIWNNIYLSKFAVVASKLEMTYGNKSKFCFFTVFKIKIATLRLE